MDNISSVLSEFIVLAVCFPFDVLAADVFSFVGSISLADVVCGHCFTPLLPSAVLNAPPNVVKNHVRKIDHNNVVITQLLSQSIDK